MSHSSSSLSKQIKFFAYHSSEGKSSGYESNYEDEEGRHQKKTKLGQGGFGTVHEFLHTLSGKQTAVKTLRRLSHQTTEEFKAVVIREALFNYQVYGVGEYILDEKGDTAWIKMLYLPGIPLTKYLEKTDDLEEIIPVLIKMMSFLHYKIHTHDIVQSDIAPYNIMVDEKSSEVFIYDFGVSDRVGTLTRLASNRSIAPETSKHGITRDPNQDVYSIGHILEKIAKKTQSSILAAIAADMKQEDPHKRLSLPKAIKQLQKKLKDISALNKLAAAKTKTIIQQGLKKLNDDKSADYSYLFIRATSIGNIKFLRKIIKKVTPDCLKAALFAAARKGYRKTVGFLIKEGADIKSAFMEAVRDGKQEVVATLSTFCKDEVIVVNLLYLAAFNAHKDIVQILIEKPSDIELALTAAINDIQRKTQEKNETATQQAKAALTMLLPYATLDHLASTFVTAVEKNTTIETIQYLLESVVNKSHLVEILRKTSVVKMILQKWTTEILSSEMFYFAASDANKEIVKLFIDNGANVRLALLRAVKENNIKVFKMLFPYRGVDLELHNLFYLAVSNNYADILKILFQNVNRDQIRSIFTDMAEKKDMKALEYLKQLDVIFAIEKYQESLEDTSLGYKYSQLLLNKIKSSTTEEKTCGVIKEFLVTGQLTIKSNDHSIGFFDRRFSTSLYSNQKLKSILADTLKIHMVGSHPISATDIQEHVDSVVKYQTNVHQWRKS